MVVDIAIKEAPIEAALKTITALGALIQCPAHTQLCRQGEPSQSVYVLVGGYVVFKCTDNKGKEYIAGLRSPICVLGANCATLGEPSPVTVSTIGASRLYVIDASHVLSAQRTDHSVTATLLRLQYRESFEQFKTLSALALRSAKSRLAEFLINMCKGVPAKDGKIKLQLPLKQEEIAQMLNVTPQYLSVLYGELESDDTVARCSGWLIIPDIDRLLAVADQDFARGK